MKIREDVPPNIQWLSHPEGHRFFVDSILNVHQKNGILSSSQCEGTLNLRSFTILFYVCIL